MYCTSQCISDMSVQGYYKSSHIAQALHTYIPPFEPHPLLCLKRVTLVHGVTQRDYLLYDDDVMVLLFTGLLWLLPHIFQMPCIDVHNEYMYSIICIVYVNM